MAVNTFGWDMVYAMRFSEANAELERMHNQEISDQELIRKNILQELASFDTSLQNKISAVADFNNYLYTKTPILKCYSMLSGTGVNSTLQLLMKVKKIDVINTGTGYTSNPIASFIGGNPNTPAVATVNVFIKEINITNSGDGLYSSATITISGSGGATATATIDVSGNVGTITLTNPGSGYDFASPPTVTISGDGSGATADVVLGIEIILTNSGSGYQSVPTLSLSTGTGAVIDVFMLIEEIKGDEEVDDKVAPMLQIERDPADTPMRFNSTNNTYEIAVINDVDKVYATFVYSNPSKVAGANSKELFLKLFKKAIYQFLVTSTTLKTDNQTRLWSINFTEAELDSKLNLSLNDTDLVLDKVKLIIETAYDFIFEKTTIFYPNHELSLLQKYKLNSSDAKLTKEVTFLVNKEAGSFEDKVNNRIVF